MGGEFFTDFKSLNGIEISWLVQALLNFYWFLGSTPLGVVDGSMGMEVGMGVWGVNYVHTHPHACIRMHACTHMHVKHANHAKHGCLQVGGHLQFLYMYTCTYVHVRACMCMCVCGGTPSHAPRCPWHPPPLCPLPRAAGSPKQQNSISPELIEIIRFCLKILYLWTFLNSYRL